MLIVAAAALLAGFLGVITGIGGVIVVPALTEFGKVPIEEAIGTTMFAFMFSGPLTAYVVLRRTALAFAPVAALCLGAAAGALLGAVTLDFLPGRPVRLFVAAVAAVTGLHALFKTDRSSVNARVPGSAALTALGLIVGWGSALSGTGGPVMLIPILLGLGIPTATAVGFGLAAHVPIVVAATAMNFAAGRIDFALGATLGGLLVVGILAGMWLVSRLSSHNLTTSVALALVAVGGWYAYATFASG